MVRDRWSRRAVLAGSGAAIVGGLAGCLSGTGDDQWTTDDTLPVTTAHQYNAPNCTCCDRYAAYLQDHLDAALDVTDADDIDAVKRDRGVPGDLKSCHTVVLDSYVIEGHVPVGQVAALLDDEPSVAGIALPGMPSGSPGMGGEKDDSWTFYAFHDDGRYEEFAIL